LSNIKQINKTVMEYQILQIAGVDLIVKTQQATKPFKLHPLDVEFIEQDIEENKSENGELQCIVEEGIMDFYWRVLPTCKTFRREARKEWNKDFGSDWYLFLHEKQLIRDMKQK